MALPAHCGCHIHIATTVCRAKLWNTVEKSPYVSPRWVARSLQRHHQKPGQACRAAGKRGRPPKQASVDDEEITVTEFGKLGTKEDPSRDAREALMAEIINDDDELADWTQRVVDWNEFKEDSPTAGFGGDVEGLPWGNDVAERHRIVRRQMKVLQEKDPTYISSLPLETHKVYPEQVLPEPEPLDFAPDGWGPWDFRAFVEKQKRVRREHAEWVQSQHTIGQFQYMHVDETTDVRMQNVWDEPRRTWTNEDIFNLIIDHGKNALPTDVVVAVENPKTKADLQKTGGLYHESNEEFLERTGHLLHGDEPTKADLDEALGIDRDFMNDFEGLDINPEVDAAPTGTEAVNETESLADVDLEDELEEGMD